MSEQSVLDEVRDRLVAGVPRYERRKRRRAGLAVAAIAALACVGVASQLVRDDSRQPVVVSPSSSTPERPVPAGFADVLIATSGNQFGVSITDLGSGKVLEYPGGTHAMGPGAVAGAVVIPRGGFLMWRTGEATQLFRNVADRAGIPIGSIRGERTVVVTEDGTGAWILAAGDGETALEFVDLNTREIDLSTTMPARSRLIATRGDSAVLEPNATLPGDHVTLVEPSGRATRLAVPEPARLLAVGAQGSVWIAADGERLLMLDASGRKTAEVRAPFGRWTTTGHATIPSNSSDFRTITADGERVLVALTDPDDINGGTRALAVADLTEGKADVVDVEGDSFGSAFWADGDDTIVLIDWDGGEQQSVTALSPASGNERRLDGAVPRGYFVIAAG